MVSSSHPLYGQINLFRYYKSLTEKATAQISPSQIRRPVAPGLHSPAILMKHLSGNMISRWTNFRTEDGEKPWRNREQEFFDDFSSEKELYDYWKQGWTVLFGSLQSIRKDELKEIILIRNQEHTISEAVDRHLAHVAYHTGQIVLICRIYAGESWQSLSIPKGKTAEYNRKKFSEKSGRGPYSDRL